MATFVALLRAVNVGGTGKLPSADLKNLCEKAGFAPVRTYIQSGNVVLGTRLGVAKVKSTLEAALLKKLGKACRVLVRSADELEKVLAANPYPEAEPARLIVTFFDDPLPRDALKGWPIPGTERLALRGRELFTHYPDGQGVSKLKSPFADIGTGRNLNSVRALLAIAREFDNFPR